MDKNLGTNLHLGGFFSYNIKNKQRWSLVSRIFTSFNFVPDEITENYEHCVTVPRNFV